MIYFPDLFLRNAIGFFLQLYPCAWMLAYPFEDPLFRIPKKTVYYWLAVYCLLCALGFPLFLFFFGSDWRNLYMVISIVILLILYFRINSASAIRKWMIVIPIVFYAVVQIWLVESVEIMTGTINVSQISAYSWITDGLYALGALISMPVMVYLVLKPASEFIRHLQMDQIRREFYLLLLSTVIYFILITYLSSLGLGEDPDGNRMAYETFLLFLTLNQVLVYWLTFRESIRYQLEQERRHFGEIQHLQYDKIAGEIENMRHLRHDLRHHLNMISSLNAQRKYNEISQYLSRYITVYDQINLNLPGEDPVVASVLEYYLNLAREQEIEVDYQISLPSSRDIEPTDMTVLLGNCLENALEELRKIDPQKERKLSIVITQVNDSIAIRIINSSQNSLNMDQPESWNLFQTTKDSGDHGIGLQSVDTISRKYQGNAQFQNRNGQFITRIILNPTRRIAE